MLLQRYTISSSKDELLHKIDNNSIDKAAPQFYSAEQLEHPSSSLPFFSQEQHYEHDSMAACSQRTY